MSAPDSRVRKSNRQPVPNPIYQQGISQLKNENTSRIKRKTNKNNEQQLLSYDEERNSQAHYEQSLNISESGKDQYLPCRLPNGTQVKVRFVLENKKQEKKKEKEKQVVQPPPRQTPQPPQASKKPQTNLLSLFIQAIDNAQGPEQASSYINADLKQIQVPVEKQKAPVPKPKRSRQEQEDFIKKVIIENKKMIIVHSQLEGLEFPVDWEESKMMAQQRTAQIQEIRRKLENCKVLKNIPILAP